MGVDWSIGQYVSRLSGAPEPDKLNFERVELFFYIFSSHVGGGGMLVCVCVRKKERKKQRVISCKGRRGPIWDSV